MPEEAEVIETGHRPLLIAVGSLLAPGSGQWHVGRPVRAAAAFLLAGGSLPLLSALLLHLGVPVHLFFWPVVGVFLLATLGVAVDAARLEARATRARPTPLWMALGVMTALSIGAQGLTRDHVLETFRTPSPSMEPTLEVGDRFVVSKLTRRDREPQRGDLVVFTPPGERYAGQVYVKRVVGVPGDRVVCEEHRLEVNGEALRFEAQGSDEFLETHAGGASYRVRVDPRVAPRPRTELTLGDEEYFVLGDNRAHSIDSRYFGPVRAEHMQGRAVAKWGLDLSASSLVPKGTP